MPTDEEMRLLLEIMSKAPDYKAMTRNLVEANRRLDIKIARNERVLDEMFGPLPPMETK